MKNILKKYCLISLILLFMLLPSFQYAINSDHFSSHIFCSIIYSLPILFFLLLFKNKIIRWILLSVVWLITFFGGIFVAVYGNYVNESEWLGIILTNQYEANDLFGLIIYYYYGYVIVMFILWMIASILTFITQFDYKKSMFGVLFSIVLSLPFVFKYPIYNYMPYLVIHKYIHAQHQIAEITLSGEIKNEVKLPFANGSDRRRILVLAVGESLNYSHISKEYERKTMPLITAMPNVVSYSNYYANALYTHQSLPLLLSSKSLTYENECEYNIFDVFSCCDYKSYFISHKAQLTNNGIHNYLNSTCDSVIFVDNDSCIHYEMSKLIETNAHENIFFVLHFLGNHAAYSNCPNGFKQYYPDYNDSPKILNDSSIINAYDNSIRYQDYVLHLCISTLENVDANSCLLFVSDHGEYVDERRGGHGFSEKPCKDEYHVPFIVWYNDSYKSTYDDKVINIIKHRDEPICGDNIFWSLLDLADINIKTQDNSRGMIISKDTLLVNDRKLLLPDGKTIISLK